MILNLLVFILLLSLIKGDYQTVSYSLSDSYSYAYFTGYVSASFNLDGNSGKVDFWVVDEDGFNTWKSSKTPSTSKSYTGTYCNDCSNYNTVFDLPNTYTKYYFIISALFPSSTSSGLLSITYTGGGSYSTATEEQDATCFGEDSLIHLKNGSSIPIKYAQIGDEILSSTYSGQLVYSPIISIPHPINNELHSKALKIIVENQNNDKLSTSSSITTTTTSLSLTYDHLLPVCHEYDCSKCTTNSLLPFKLIYSQEVEVNMCLLTTTGITSQWNKVQSVTTIQSLKGLYSVVTISPYPVINNVISSPFGLNHFFPSLYYKIHTIFYQIGLMKYPFIQDGLNQINEIMTDLLSKKSFHDQFRTISKQFLSF